MAQRVNRELVENLRPFITRIAQQAIGAYTGPPPGNVPTPEGPRTSERGGVVFYDSKTYMWHRVFLYDGQLYLEISASHGVDGGAVVPIVVPIPEQKDPSIYKQPANNPTSTASRSVTAPPTNNPSTPAEESFPTSSIPTWGTL